MLFRSGIFSGNPYAVPLRDPTLYDIPQETLDANPSFAALMEEAVKYIGYPYGATCSQLKRLGTCPMIGGEKKDR